ncbi:hypothetical protein IAU59_006425 [Kwoniella sp. CBS 9459]
MPPRLPIPRFTLYTGGKECSLCEVAKHELSVLRRTTPFDLTLWNIRDPPENADVKEAKKWRRLYQYDIPVLHLGEKRIQKHRIDRSKLQTFIEEWHASHAQRQQEPQQQSSDPAAKAIIPETAAEMKKFSSACSRSGQDGSTQQGGDLVDGNAGRQETGATMSGEADLESARPKGKAPWQTYLGKTFFHLPSPVAEYTPESEWDIFVPLLKQSFKGFSDIPVGSDVPVIDLSESGVNAPPRDGEDELSWEVDTRPGVIGIDGHSGDVLYDEPTREVTGWQTNQVCWNCLDTGHAFNSCPHPRNYAQVRKSREEFIYARDYLMPDQAVPTLQLYLDMRVTQDEKDRRLDLVDRFVPGMISAQLEDAICFVDIPDGIGNESSDEGVEGVEEEGPSVRQERELADVKRRRKRWDWYEGMMRWGYPPGWVAGKDPIEEMKRRILSLQVHEKPFNSTIELENGDHLQVFGGTLSTPTSSRDGQSPDPGNTSIESNSESTLDSGVSSSVPQKCRTGDEGGPGDARTGMDSDTDKDTDMDMELDSDEDSCSEPPFRVYPAHDVGPTFTTKGHLEVDVRSQDATKCQMPPPPVCLLKESLPLSGTGMPLPSPPFENFDPPPPPPEDEVPPPPPPDDIPPPPPPPEDRPASPPPPDGLPSTPPSPSYANGRYTHHPQRISSPLRTAHTPRLIDNTQHLHTHTHVHPNTPESQHDHSYPRHLTIPSQPRAADLSTPSRSASASKSIPTGPKGYRPPTPLRRWAKYHTDLFDSERLMVYSETRPFPIGS